MKAFIAGILLSAAALMLLATFTMRHALACELLPLLDYRRAGAELFVERSMPAAQMDTLLVLTDSASERIIDVYGMPRSKPRMLVAADPGSASRWGANETASMHRSPWRSCIVIGSEGQNVDVIAHEWLHAEIQHRVGLWRFLAEIPIWFDEGAALTVDYRDPYLPANIDLSAGEIAAVKDLKRARAFFSGNVRQNYQAARMAVEPLISPERFFDDLGRISAGESFDTVFLHAGRAAHPSTGASAD